MLISLNWLKQYVDIKESIDEIANALTMICLLYTSDAADEL